MKIIRDKNGNIAHIVDIVSSNVNQISYNEEKQELEITFKKGDGPARKYRHFNVPREIMDGLLKASSIGSFVNKKINPFYPGQRVTDED